MLQVGSRKAASSPATELTIPLETGTSTMGGGDNIIGGGITGDECCGGTGAGTGGDGGGTGDDAASSRGSLQTRPPIMQEP